MTLQAPGNPRPQGSAREAAERVVRELRRAGHSAYFAGGCVRDELLGLHPKDYDVATGATPDQVGGLFRSTREVGKAFGVMLVRLMGVTVEVTTFRKEGEYSDRRRPDSVIFADARSDAERRDFTINALFLDPLAPAEAGLKGAVRGAVIDFVGGRADLEAGVVRAVGDADARLAEDHLRALRAVRFAARLGFTIDAPTIDAIRRHARELAGVSRERIGDELRRMLAAPTRGAAVRLIESLGLDGPVLDEEAHALEQRPGAAASVAGLPEKADFAWALAAWALDRAGAGSSLHGAGARAGRAGARWRAALCLSTEERERFGEILVSFDRIVDAWDGMGVAPRKRLASRASFEPALTLVGLVDAGRERGVRAEVGVLARSHGGLSPAALLTGDDLIASGFSPGPAFGRWLDGAYDAQLEGRVTTREGALALVRALVSEEQSPGVEPRTRGELK